MLLIDEVDRADEEFEAFLLEVLSDFQVSIPELGTIRAERRPTVVLTSNRTRELHDALKRRCLYHWIGHPSVEREIEIVAPARAGRRRPARRGGRALRGAAPRSRPAEAARASPRRSTGCRPWRRSGGRSSTSSTSRRRSAPCSSTTRICSRSATSELADLVAAPHEASERRPRPAPGRVRAGAARGRARGRPGPDSGRASRPRPHRPHPPRRRLLDPAPDAGLAGRGHRSLRSCVGGLVPARRPPAVQARAARQRPGPRQRRPGAPPPSAAERDGGEVRPGGASEREQLRTARLRGDDA